MQNCEEKIPILDLTELNEIELNTFLLMISKACEELAKESCVVIKITKLEG